LVEESAAAAESLRNQADQLVQAVAVFSLQGDGAAHATATPGVQRARRAEHRPGANVIRPPFGSTKRALSSGAAQLPKTGTDDWTNF